MKKEDIKSYRNSGNRVRQRKHSCVTPWFHQSCVFLVALKQHNAQTVFSFYFLFGVNYNQALIGWTFVICFIFHLRCRSFKPFRFRFWARYYCVRPAASMTTHACSTFHWFTVLCDCTASVWRQLGCDCGRQLFSFLRPYGPGRQVKYKANAAAASALYMTLRGGVGSPLFSWMIFTRIGTCSLPFRSGGETVEKNDPFYGGTITCEMRATVWNKAGTVGACLWIHELRGISVLHSAH